MHTTTDDGSFVLAAGLEVDSNNRNVHTCKKRNGSCLFTRAVGDWSANCHFKSARAATLVAFDR